MNTGKSWPDQSSVAPNYDFIVCGAGSAGSVVAGQLAANPDVRVLLLEAGGTDETERVLDPNQWISTLGSDLDWGFNTEPNSHLNDRSLLYSMGRGLGGGGSINVAVWSRGHKADWDYFAEASGDPAWNYNSVLQLYERIETRQGQQKQESPSMWIQPAQNPHPFFSAALDGMAAQGMERFEELSGALWESPNGCAYVDEIVHDSRRQSPYRSFVHPRRHQTNLTILTGATVRRVLCEGNQAVGVEFSQEGKISTVGATLEVVLSLGTIHTAKVLMQSGIGDSGELGAFSIPVVQHLPGVGKHMHDHISFGCAWEASDLDMPTAPRGQSVCFWKTDRSLEVPNALAFAIPIVYATPENMAKYKPPATGWSLFAGLATEGRGRLHLTGRDETDPIRIETDFLSDPKDLQTALEVIETCRSIGNSEALHPYARRELLPGALDAGEMEQFVRNGVATFWHQSGTARMGTDDQAVVDAELRVHGIRGLRVADASIMPRVTVGNTMAPCVVIGQRAVDLLEKEHGLRG